MSHTLTPVAQHDGASLVISADGEVWGALTGPAPFKTVFQHLVDRDELALGGIASRLAWSEELSVDAGGSAGTFAVNVGAIQTVVLVRDGVYRAYFANAATIGASKIEGGGNLVGDTWYYVYAWDNAGAVDYQISTTAPRASRQYKNAVGNIYRYLGCFRTASSGAPLPMRASRGRYLYSAIPAEGSFLLTGLNATTWTLASLAARVPPHARRATIAAAVKQLDASHAAVFSVRAPGSTTAWDYCGVNEGTVVARRWRTELELDSSQRFEYVINNAAYAEAQVDVHGFAE